MTISDENFKKVTELAGAQVPSTETQKKISHSLRRFKRNFPSLNWWGNTPIEPTGAGLTYAESITWIRHILNHLSDWAGKMNDELNQLVKDLNDLEIIIKEELVEQLPDIIIKYDLFDLIVTGNNEKIRSIAHTTTTTKPEQTVFSYSFRTDNGIMEADKTNINHKDDCANNLSKWVFHVDERKGSNVLDFFLVVKNIPAEVNRLWLINQYPVKISGKKEAYFVANNQIKRMIFDNDSGALLANPNEGINLAVDTINTNYEPYWIVNVFKRAVNQKNYLHYMTLDYKVYEYDLQSGDEKFLYRIPGQHQDIFDPIHDVIEGKSTIWAITYKGTVNRQLKEMNGLCISSCFDGKELYETWETPQKIVFTDNFYGITPGNLYQNYADLDEENGDKSLRSSFLLSKKETSNPYVLDIYELSPKNYNNEAISYELDKIFKDTIVKNLYNHKSLADFQGYFTYNLGDDLSNFTDAPSLLLSDTEKSDGAIFVLENSQFVSESRYRTFWQRLKVFNQEYDNNRSMRVYERTVKQKIDLSGLSETKTTRWHDSSLPVSSEKLDSAMNINKKFDYLSLAGSHRIFNANQFETTFNDTPCQTYIYYDLPIDMSHPLLKNLNKKNVIVEVTKGTPCEFDTNKYEIVIKLTYQDEFAELQFRRLMRFDRSDKNGDRGGRNRATYISPWAYVYYTVPDDSAGEEYVPNPNQGIDQKFYDIINNLQNQIDQLFNEINNIYNEIAGIKKEITEINKKIDNIEKVINNMQEDINNLYQKVEMNMEPLIKVLNSLKKIGVWVQDGDTVLEGHIPENMGIAGGNINLFGGAADGATWIRTNPGKTENDIVAGV